MDTAENEQVVLSNGEVEYGSFEEYWSAFTDQPFWLRYRPIFVHKDYKPFLRDFFININEGSLTIVELFRQSLWVHKIES